MNETPKFLVCKHCGNVIEMLHDSGVAVICCGEPMAEMVPGTSDGAAEKHVPAYTQEGNTIQVQVGSVIHPSLPEHYIGWIWLQTRLGGQRRRLSPGDEPKATFTLAPGDEAVAVYEWCNLHGLWKADVK
ncbi:desulfoferrodoxin [Ruminococcaceae bacterium OttesenSCG-928-O06]|nr:desulfoferrodoxin [Ruminococcaceae bacterium OttesenSCG-928-O06]